MNSDFIAPPMSNPLARASTNPAARPRPDDDSDQGDDQRSRVLVVCVGASEYAIPVTQVREVFRAERVTLVPGSPLLVRGIVNVRGVVVTVLELSELLGTTRAVRSTSVVLLEHGSRLIGLAVDSVRDVRAQPVTPTDGDTTRALVAPLDAIALCAPHLLSSEEMGR